MGSAWRTLASGWTGAAWSPTGARLMVWQQAVNGSPDDAILTIHNPDGSIAQSLAGVGAGGINAAVWLDDTNFVARKGAFSVIVRLGSSELWPLAAPATPSLLANGQGAVTWEEPSDSLADAEYRVWSGSGLTERQPGLPAAWSHDGSKLAVWHWRSGSGPTSLGWLEVLRWPDLNPIVTLQDEAIGLPGPGAVVFDPSDGYLYDGHIHDLLTGAIATPDWPEPVADVVWASGPRLVGAGQATGRAFFCDLTGRVLLTSEPLGDEVAVSADGSTLVFWYSADARPIAIQDRAGLRSVAVPGPVQPAVLLSPNGSGLVIGSGTEPMLLVSAGS